MAEPHRKPVTDSETQIMKNGTSSDSTCDASGECGVSSRPAAISDGAVTTSSLQALQSSDQRSMMDLVDNLRRQGLSSEVELPQLVVCDDQSSGKSSVLEGFTEIPFPRKENLCTRFATGISLRRSPDSTSTVTIFPDKSRSTPEQDELKDFQKSITDFNQLSEIIEQATEAMGLGAVGSTNSRAFSRDVLSPEITGPDRPQLTLVDLPGLIHATNKTQTQSDKELILDLVKEHMRNPRTIILAVVSAKNDFANQIILDYCREIDGRGRRTLGIITKPDFLREGTENELNWIDLALNKNIKLELGWHMLKNRDDNQMQFSFKQRNEDEMLFFSKGRYTSLARESVGIGALRQRLSKILLKHLIEELPSLQKEMAEKLNITLTAIKKFGEKRETIEEQRAVLMQVSIKVNDTIKCAIRGHYNICRLRAAIQHLNVAFAKDMRLRGHKYSIGARPGDSKQVVEEKTARRELQVRSEDGMPYRPGIPIPRHLTRDEGVGWVRKSLGLTRGTELPGTYQPALIAQLFHEMCEPWKDITTAHLEKIHRACTEFVRIVIRDSAPEEFYSPLASLNLDIVLNKARMAAKTELNKLFQDLKLDPSTYNHYFTTTIQKIRQQKHQSMLKAAQENGAESGTKQKTRTNPAKIIANMDKAIELDMDTFCSQEALDVMRAYYKDEMKYFINAVTKTVIERHLIQPLPKEILSPVLVSKMTENDIKFVAAEPGEISKKRSYLEARIVMLKDGLETFREAVGKLDR